MTLCCSCPVGALKYSVLKRAAQGLGGGYLQGTIVSGQLLQGLGLKNWKFENVDCSFVNPEGGNLGLSAYGSGLLCAGMLSKCRVIVDYARHRIAFIPASLEKSEERPPKKKTDKPKRINSLPWLIYFLLAISVDIIRFICRALGKPGFD